MLRSIVTMIRRIMIPLERHGRPLVIGLPYLWLAVFFLAPFAIVVKISMSDPATAQPPYTPVLNWRGTFAEWQDFLLALDFENFETLWADDLYWQAGLASLRIAAVSTVLLLVAGYPLAYAMSRASRGVRPLLVALVILPFWTSFLIRVYAWIGILKPEGLLNQLLIGLGLIAEPLVVLNTPTAVYVGIVYAYLPFMVLPLYSALERQDPALLEAAQDLGARPAKAFWTVTVPLSLPGVVAGALLCFIPIVGEFVIPDLLGGSDTLMIGRTLWSEFFGNRDWPLASAVAVAMLLVIVIPIVIYRELEAQRWEATR
jgi:putrescine transport system permease protein